MAERVTIIVPTYRRPQMMARAVRSALNQTYQDLQVDIYDNASDDQTAEVAMALAAEDPRVRYHRRQQNIGLVENFADAQAAVKTEYFSFLADDDLLLPEFLQRAVASLSADREAMFVASPVPLVNSRGRILLVAGHNWPIGLQRPPDAMMALLRRGHFVWTGTVFRRAVTEQVGLLDPKASVCSDLDFQLRIAGRFPFLTIPDIGAVFSWHQDSATSLPRLNQFWPAWEWIAAKLSQDNAIPLEHRIQVARTLRSRLPRKVFLVGLLASALERDEEATEAAQLLTERFARPMEAGTIRALAAACRKMPRLRQRLAKFAGWVRWLKPIPRGLQADFDGRYAGLLALPEGSAGRRKDSAA